MQVFPYIDLRNSYRSQASKFLSDRAFSVDRETKRERRRLTDAKDLLQVLASEFDLHFPAGPRFRARESAGHGL